MLMNYWAPVKKLAILRPITGLITFGNFSYYIGPSPARFWAFRWGVGIYSGGPVTMG